MLAVALSLVTTDVNTRRDAVVEVVQRVSPAVVFIGTVQVVEGRFHPQNMIQQFLYGDLEERHAVEGLGSGVIVDPNGTIVTNEHVIRGAAEIHVVLADGRQAQAEVIGSNADNDLAVLKVNVKGPLPAAKLGTSSDLMIGEKAVAIGSPFGLKKTVTVGVVSAVGRSFKAEDRTYDDLVQTDASINPGNSGGPLLNIDGEVIGINSAIVASAQGIGFAIPADKVKRIVNELTQFGKVRPSWIGIDVQELTPNLAKKLGWDRTFGAIVASIEAGSPAETAGVQRGDIVTQVGTTQVENDEDFRERMKGYPAKTPLPLTIFRNGATVNVSLNPVEFPAKLVDSLAWDRLGLRMKSAGKGGMQITAVRPGSSAARIGLEPGDAVLRLNNLPLESADAFRDALIAARSARSVLLIVKRGNAGYYLTLPFRSDRG
ncbi:MAG: trypsin-like peptidase domain-containing protein [Myxococcaceae bacterium]